MDKEIYLDNSATTKVDDSVIEKMVTVMKNDYGNPSSKHMKGVEAEKYLRDAAETISGILKVDKSEIIFTSGGTESNNLAITGAALANQRSGKHIITSRTEHDSVLKVCEHLEKQGFEVTYLDVNRLGLVDPEQLKEKLRDDTIIVSIMHVNNETGAVQDVAAIGKIIKAHNPKTLFHVDAVQSFGKYFLHSKQVNIDMLSVSAHKIHGPKGAGFLYVNRGVKIIPQILGGGQQKGMRSGTDNVPGVCGLAQACRLAYSESAAFFPAHDKESKELLNRVMKQEISPGVSMKNKDADENHRVSPLAHNSTEKSNSYKNMITEKAGRIFELREYFIERLRDVSEPSDSDGCEESIKISLHINSAYYDMLTAEERADYLIEAETDILKITAPHVISVTFRNVKSEVLLHALEEKGIYVSAGSACASNRNAVSHTLTAMGLSKQEADSTLRFSLSDLNTEEEIDRTVSALVKLVPLLSKFVSR